MVVKSTSATQNPAANSDKRYSKTAENDKIKRMLLNERNKNKRITNENFYANHNIDFDKIDKELSKKYGGYDKQDLMQSSSSSDSSSESEMSTKK